MKITLISPPFGEYVKSGTLMKLSKLDEIQKSEGLPIAPPVLEYLAGLTEQISPDIEVELIDVNREEFNDKVLDSLDADLIGITVLTPQAPWSYKTADLLRARGRKVVLGGMHVSVLPEEAKEHADSVVIGEAEGIWEELLGDLKAGMLKPFYKGGQIELSKLPRPKKGLLKTKYPMGSFFTARGCPFKCKYCSVYQYFGNNIRHRPIDDVVAEVAQSPYWMFWNVDDNIWGAGVDRSIKLYIELYKELEHMRKWWIGSGDLVSVQHSRGVELLKTAKKSGLTLVMVGWETENLSSLEEWNALHKQGSSRFEAVKKIKDHGIDVMMFFMMGGRKDTPGDYMRALDVCDRLGVMPHPMQVTPFPGTELYNEYKPYLIPGKGWEHFNGNRVVFEHSDPMMSVEKREQALFWLRAEGFSPMRVIKRLCSIKLSGFPMTHVTSAMIQIPMSRAFREIREGNPYAK
ncbi:MAG: B12-binding domain-containing radical SAM protein [Deltaproteobacteria bacterium]|nr:B12-binding domain-containing radical SAM protein [Deltaproteobacteria bacterium]